MDKTDQRLEGEGMSVMTAGYVHPSTESFGLLVFVADPGDSSNTTGHTLSIIAYHLIKHADVLRRLQAELQMEQQKSATPLKWAQLEQLPYLASLLPSGRRLSCHQTYYFSQMDIANYPKNAIVTEGLR